MSKRQRKCFAPGCTTGYASNKEKLSMFRVTKNTNLFAWRSAVPRRDKVLAIGDVLCEKHFHQDDILREVITETYSYALKIPRLKNNAVPCVWPNCPPYLTKTCRKRRVLVKQEYDVSAKKRLKQSTSEGALDEIVTPDESPVPDKQKNRNVFDSLWNKKIALTLPADSWTVHFLSSSEGENLIALLQIILIDNEALILKKIMISESQINCYIFQHLHEKNLKPIVSIADIEDILQYFDGLPVCFGSVLEVPANFSSTVYRKDDSSKSWRHQNCNMYLEDTASSNCCAHCQKFKKVIKYSTKKVTKAIATRKTLFIKRALNRRRRERRLQLRFQQTKKELTEVKNKMKEVSEEELRRRIEDMENLHSAQKMSIIECIKMAKYKSKSSRRYSSNWLLMCLLLHIKSPKTYRFLKENEILPLPVISTVRKYLSKVHLKCGLDEEFFEAFKLKLAEKNEYEKQGILIFDEMSVRVNINLNVKNMKLVGAQDFGDEIINKTKTEQVTNMKADHALVFMWSSLASNLSQPIAVYAAKGPTKGTCLSQLILEIIRKLESCGAEIHGVVCDGASTNRRMWTEFGISGKLSNAVNKIVHPMEDARNLFFLSDTPHLIKCLRNRLLMKKALMTPDGGVHWEYYKQLFHLDQSQASNLRVCPKLTEMHINPNSFMKMRVRLATQIFSKSVADGLLYYQRRSPNFDKADSTIVFTSRVNNLFDALNRRTSKEGIRQDSTDLKILKDNLDFYNDWEKMVVQGTITKNEFLTPSTAEGFRVTIMSTIELCEYLLQQRKFTYVLTNKMNQDPLERFFGTIRQAGCDNDHPTMGNFLQMYRLLSVYKLLKPPKFGNCTNVTSEDTSPAHILSLDNFKTIFATNDSETKSNHLSKIRQKLDDILESEEWESSEEKVSVIYDPEVPHTLECIIYYLTGFICKKTYKESKCQSCKISLYNLKPHNTPPVSELLEIKSKGWLNHPNASIHIFLRKLELVLVKHISSVDVFEDTLDDFFSHEENRMTAFACHEHREEILSKCCYYYICMRVKQFYKQEGRKLEKKSANSRKMSKLQES